MRILIYLMLLTKQEKDISLFLILKLFIKVRNIQNKLERTNIY